MGLKAGGLRGSLRSVSTGVGAIPDSVVEDWESGTLSAWTTTTPVFEVTQSNVVEGSHALGTTGGDDTGEKFAYSLPGDGADYYPQKGDRLSCLVRDTPSNANIPGVGVYGDYVNNTVVGIRAFFWADNNSLILERLDSDGSTVELDSASPALSSDTWYDWDIQLHDGSGSEMDDEIVYTLYEVDTSASLSEELGRTTEVATLQANDSTHSGNRGVFVDLGSSDTNQSPISDRYWHLGSVE